MKAQGVLREQIHAVLMAVLPQRDSMTLDPGDLSCEGDMGMAPGEGGLELRLFFFF